MNILFVADPLATFKIHKDSTFAMMRELQRRGHTVWSTEPQHLSWHAGASVSAACTELRLTGEADAWYAVRSESRRPLHGFDAVLMRKDPPFDSEFFYATHLLEQAEREGARVFNSPRALRDHPEKLALMEFACFAPPTLVTRSADEIRAFHAEHQDIILKPLDGMGGMGIFRVKADGLSWVSFSPVWAWASWCQLSVLGACRTFGRCGPISGSPWRPLVWCFLSRLGCGGRPCRQYSLPRTLNKQSPKCRAAGC
jgi:glutathione synthase